MNIKNLEDYSRYSIIIMLFGLSLSTAGANFALAGFLVFAILSGRLQKDFHLIIDSPVVRSSLVLFVILCLSVIWTEAQAYIAWQWVSKYKKLLLIPLAAPFFQERDHKLLLFKGLIVSLGIGLSISYLNYLGLLSIGNCPNVGCSTHSYITLSMLNCLLLIISSAFFIFSHRPVIKLFAIVIAALALINVLWILPSRTGQLMVFCLLVGLLFLLARRPDYFFNSNPKKIFICFLLLLGTLVGSFFIVKGSRLSESIQKIVLYKDEALRSNDSNIAIDVRSEIYRKTIQLIAEKPFIGWGAGGQEAQLLRMSESGVTANERYIFANPHNEYLSWAVQVGTLGLVAYLYWLITVWRSALKAEDSFDKTILTSWLLIFTMGSFFNSFLLDFSEGYMTVLLIAALIPLKSERCFSGGRY